MRKEQNSANEVNSSDTDLTPQSIDALVEDMAAHLESIPKDVRKMFLVEYRANTEAIRLQIIDTFNNSINQPAIFGPATVRGAVYDLMKNFRETADKKESYGSYLKFMEEQGIKPVEEEIFFLRKGSDNHRHAGGSWVEARLRANKTRGREANLSILSVHEHWQAIIKSKIDIESKVKHSKIPPGRAQREYTVVRITRDCMLEFKGDRIGSSNFPQNYYLVIDHQA